MPLEVRETGSIIVPARKDEVLGVLGQIIGSGARVGPDRFESFGSTYVLRERGDATQIIHARSESTPMALAHREREELRRAVQSDLFDLQRAFNVRTR